MNHTSTQSSTSAPPPQQALPASKAEGKEKGFGKGMLGAAGGAVAGAVLVGSLYV